MAWFRIALCFLALAVCVPFPASAEEIRVGTLAGALCLPEGVPVATVVILPGSGPVTRDGDIPATRMFPGTYRLLAESLAAEGIATVRVDKRGAFGSAAEGVDPNAVTLDRYAEDARAWIAATREATGASCVWLLGHSEGGLVALRAAEEAEGLCGVILAAVPGRRMGVLLREQLQSNPANAPVLEQAFAAIDSLESGKPVDVGPLHPALHPLFAPVLQHYLMDMMRVEPARLIAAVRVPILIVQGTQDIQVKLTDAEILHAASPSSTLAILDKVGHTLKEVPKGERGVMAVYTNADLPIARAVVSMVAEYIKQQAR